jgi:N-methylhydantoinase A
MRFRGQTHAMRVGVRAGDDAAAIRELFEVGYAARYGHVDNGSPLQLVNLLLSASARMERPRLEVLAPPRAADAPLRRRPVYFEERAARVETPVYRRAELESGQRIAGPAIVEEYGSTTVVGPDDRLEVGRLGELHVTFPAHGGSR